jgi:hypothetical protein
MELTSKKGQTDLTVLTFGVITLVMAGFLLVMGLLFLDELLLDSADTTVTVTAETETGVNNVSVETCARTGACGMNAFTITNLSNGTGASQDLSSGNWTIVNARTCTWRLTGDGSGWNGSTLNVSYTYRTSTGEACLATNETVFGLGEFGDYVDLIVVAIVIAIVITLVVGMTALRRIR